MNMTTREQLKAIKPGSDEMRKYLVKIGLSSLEIKMTIKQALRYGNNAMPNDLKRAGFKTTIFCSDEHPEMFNGSYLRINWGK